MFLDGLTPRRIIDRLPEGEDISERSIRRHHNRGHLPVDHKAVKRRLDGAAQERWEEIGQRATAVEIERALGAMAILNEGIHRLALDEMPLAARDILAMMKYVDQKKLLANEHQDEIDTLTHARRLLLRSTVSLFEIVGEVLGDAARDEVFHRAASDPRTSSALLDDAFTDLRGLKDDWIESMTRDERSALFDEAQGIAQARSKLTTPAPQHARVPNARPQPEAHTARRPAKTGDGELVGV